MHFAYTATVKKVLTLSLTICIAVVVGFIVSSHQRSAHIDRLISSPSITDQLRGISMLTHASYDELKKKIMVVCDKNTDASIAAQRLLVKRAFEEDRIHDLKDIPIDKELYDSALWWNASHEERPPHPTIVLKTLNPSPWVSKLMAHYDTMHQSASYPNLLSLPIRDRDGSVLLSVLAIENQAPEKIDNLIDAWSLDYDIDRQIAAVLLSSMRNSLPPNVSAQHETLNTIQAIIREKNIELAWRTMHRKDGTIHPDIALAAMIVNPSRFAPILIETAQQGKWKHPEHPILIAESFLPSITNKISAQNRHNPVSRQKWWSLLSCGLLQKEG